MKKILFVLSLLLMRFFINAQTISLGTGNEYCPNIENEFTVTLPGPYYSITTSQMQITQQPYSFNTAKTSFKFKAKFVDVNAKQFVEIQYNANGGSVFKAEYKRIKSLFHPNDFTCGTIQPKFTSNNAPVTGFNAPLCQVSTFNITFSNIKWYTEFESPKICFGSISDYEYLLPAGWKLGSNTSNGTTWLQGTNTVSITSDLSTGNGSTILIRAKNTCGANLANGQIPAQIVVSRLAGNVSMSALPNSIPCGSTSPVTFTINNTSSLSGITGYVWNLGNGNGWFYNGSPAPSSINTSTNSITLTPVCGVKVSAPSASVTLNTSGNSCGITVPASTLNIAATTLSIQGTQSLCAGTQNYSLTGMPCNATNIWSILPESGVVSLNQTSGQSTSLTRVADGNITLAAKVTACGTEYPVGSIPIHVGAYSGSYYSLNAFGSTSGQPLAVCPNQTYNFYVSSSMPLSNSIWTTPNGWTLLTGNGSSSAYIKTPASVGGGVVSVSFTEVCGTPITLGKAVYYNSNVCNLTTLYTISPNPATSNITISAGNLDPSYYISHVEITDLYGQVRLTKGLPYRYHQITVDVSNLYPAGNYIVRIYTGTQWFNKQFVKQ